MTFLFYQEPLKQGVSSKKRMNDEKCLCTRCAKMGKTCCYNRDIYITPGDVKRIREYIGEDDFYEFRSALKSEYLDQDDDPMWLKYVFNSDGSRRVLKHGISEKCIFLGEKGCTLSLNVRPLVCRLHPHTYNADDIYPELENDCPVYLLEKGETLEQAVAGICIEDARKWHRMLYDEIVLEKPNHENWTDLRPAV